MNKITAFRLDSPAQTLVIAAVDNHLPAIYYWAKPLPDDQNLEQLVRMRTVPFGPAMIRVPQNPSVCPEAGHAFPGHPGIEGADRRGTRWVTRFELQTFRLNDNCLEYVATDAVAGLRLSGVIRLDRQTDVIEASQSVENIATTDYLLNWLAAPVFPVEQDSSEMIDFTGRWCSEFQDQRQSWSVGAHMRECRLGRTSHGHFPGLVCLGATTSHTAGDAWGFHLGWSGGHRMLAEEIPSGKRQVQFGALLQAGEIRLKKGQSYRSPTLYTCYSGSGLNGMSWAFHRHVRQRIVSFPANAKSRPVYYNSWESIYFDLSVEKLKPLVDSAADMGAERFIMDDGWFPGRHNADAGLGDWQVDLDKFPQGLEPLIDYIEDKGLSFGIWVEPEMVNENSELYRTHPDWVLGVPPHKQHYCRNQAVLDLTNPAVIDYLFERLDTLLRENRISYLKWDHNRDLSLAADSQGCAAPVKQTLAFYSLLSRLREAHPDVEIESCAAGGARIDYGVLKHTHRVWLSDSNDAIERARMQRVATLFLPPEVVGSHIGSIHSHTSGRMLPANFRARVAASRHLGLELGPAELAQDNVDALCNAIKFYKQWRNLLHSGRLFQLDAVEANILAEITVAGDGTEFLLFSAQIGQLDRQVPAPLRLTGLDEHASYAVRWENADEVEPSVTQEFNSPLRSDPILVSGAVLMCVGLQLPIAFPETVWIITGKRVSKNYD